ncbi:MAG TPA: hypothetical protein VFB15_07230 [Candidatus Binataceae bacterium]|jgi:hypothetical protein|nr:hypothetical protein [Candidatus Binataceae bacterium]
MKALASLLSDLKTSCAGIALIAITVLFLTGRLGVNQYLAAVGALAGGGLVMAKDASPVTPEQKKELK